MPLSEEAVFHLVPPGRPDIAEASEPQRARLAELEEETSAEALLPRILAWQNRDCHHALERARQITEMLTGSPWKDECFELAESWENTRRALGVMIAGSKQDEASGMRLEELEVGLTISGSGNVAFVAAKAEASIVLKFKRAQGAGG